MAKGTPTFAGVQTNKCWSAGQQTADSFLFVVGDAVYIGVSNNKQENKLCNQEVQPLYSLNTTAEHTKRRNRNQ